MNRAKAEQIADRIMTRIETDKAIHKDAIADEIQAGDALDEIVDIITVDGGKMTHRDGTPFNRDADKHPDYLEHVRQAFLNAWGEPLFINGDLVLPNFDALDLDDRDTA